MEIETPRTSVGFQLIPKSEWTIPSTTQRCVLCATKFSLFSKGENCHGCGRVCCSNCLKEKLVLPGDLESLPVLVCFICAKSIKCMNKKREFAVERCRLLEKAVNHLSLTTGELQNKLREVEEENTLLLSEKESLKATIERMEIEAEVMATTATTSSLVHLSNSSPSQLSAAENGIADSSADAAAAAVKALERTKRQLDMREASLKEAFKKVASDAAKVAEQRAAFQHQERQMKAHLSMQFTALYEVERQQLEDICADAVTDVCNKYVEWIGQRQEGALQHKHTYSRLMESRQQRLAAELEELKVEHEELRQQLQRRDAEIEALHVAEPHRAALPHEVEGDAAKLSPATIEERDAPRSSTDVSAARAAAAEAQLYVARTELEAIRELLHELQQPHEPSGAAAQEDTDEEPQPSDPQPENLCEIIRRSVQKYRAERDVLQNQLQRDREDWETTQRLMREAHARNEEHQQRRDKAWKVEKAVLHDRCKELEATLEKRKASAEQLQRLVGAFKLEIAELRAKERDVEDAAKNAETESLEKTNVTPLAVSLLHEMKTTMQVCLRDHSHFLSTALLHLQYMPKATVAASIPIEGSERKLPQTSEHHEQHVPVDDSTASDGGVSRKGAPLLLQRPEPRSLRDVVQRQQRAMAELQERYETASEELRVARDAAAVHQKSL